MLAMNDAMQQGASMGQLVAMANDVSATAPQTQVAMNDAPPIAKRMPELQQANFTPPPQVPQSYLVRVAVYHSIEEASSAYQQLQEFGPVRIIRAVGANGPLFRVEMGPLDNKPDAEAALNTALGSGFGDAKLVISEPMQISMK